MAGLGGGVSDGGSGIDAAGAGDGACARHDSFKKCGFTALEWAHQRDAPWTTGTSDVLSHSPPPYVGARPVIGSAIQCSACPEILASEKWCCVALSQNGAIAYRRSWKALREQCGFCRQPAHLARDDAVERDRLSSRPQFQAFQPGRDADADLALHAKRLQRDRIVRSADQRVAADADTERRAALRAGIVAGKVARSKPRHRRKHAPGQHRLLGDAEIESDLADGRDIAVFRHALGAQHAAET